MLLSYATATGFDCLGTIEPGDNKCNNCTRGTIAQEQNLPFTIKRVNSGDHDRLINFLSYSNVPGRIYIVDTATGSEEGVLVSGTWEILKIGSPRFMVDPMLYVKDDPVYFTTIPPFDTIRHQTVYYFLTTKKMFHGMYSVDKLRVNDPAGIMILYYTLDTDRGSARPHDARGFNFTVEALTDGDTLIDYYDGNTPIYDVPIYDVTVEHYQSEWQGLDIKLEFSGSECLTYEPRVDSICTTDGLKGTGHSLAACAKLCHDKLGFHHMTNTDGFCRCCQSVTPGKDYVAGDGIGGDGQFFGVYEFVDTPTLKNVSTIEECAETCKTTTASNQFRFTSSSDPTHGQLTGTMDRSDGRQTTGCTVDQRTLDTTGWCDTVLRVKVDGVLQVIVPDFECKDPRLCANALNDKINGATVTGITTGGDMINGGIGTMTIVSGSVGDTNCESVPGFLPRNSDWIRAPNPNAQGVHCINGKALDMDSESDTYGEKLDWYGSRIEIIPTYVSELWFGTNLQVTNGWTPPIKTKTCKCCTSLSMVDDRYFDINTNESKSIAWSTDMKYYQKSVESAQIMPDWVGRNFTEVSWFESCEGNNNNNINGVPQDNDGYQWRAMNYAECDKVLKENWDYLLCALNIVKTYELSENVGAFGWLNDGQYYMNQRAKTKWATLSGNAEDRAPRSFSTCMKNIRSQSNTGSSWFSDFWNYRYYYEQYMGGFSDVVQQRPTNDKPRGCYMEAASFLGTTWTTPNSRVAYNPSGDSTTPCNDPDSLGSNTMLCTCIKQEMIPPTPEPTKTVATQYTNVISAREEEQIITGKNKGWNSREKPYRQAHSWDGRSASIHLKHENTCGLTCNSLGDTCSENDSEFAKTCCPWPKNNDHQKPFAWTDVSSITTESTCLELDIDTSVTHPLSQIQRFINNLNCTITADSFYASCNDWWDFTAHSDTNKICPELSGQTKDGNCQSHNLNGTSWQGSTSDHCTNGVYEIGKTTTINTWTNQEEGGKKLCTQKHTIFLHDTINANRCPLQAGKPNVRGTCHAIGSGHGPIETCGFDYVGSNWQRNYTGRFDISNYGNMDNKEVCDERVGGDFSQAQQNVHANRVAYDQAQQDMYGPHTPDSPPTPGIDEWWNTAVLKFCNQPFNIGGRLYIYDRTTRKYTFVPRTSTGYGNEILQSYGGHNNLIYECYLGCNSCSNVYDTSKFWNKMIETVETFYSPDNLNNWTEADCVQTANGLECYSDCDECEDIAEGVNYADCIRHHPWKPWPVDESQYDYRKWNDCPNQHFINNFAWDSRGTAVDIMLFTDEQRNSPISKKLHTVGDYEIIKNGVNKIVVSQNIRLEGQRLELDMSGDFVIEKVEPFTNPKDTDYFMKDWNSDLTSIKLIQTNSIYEYRIEIELFNSGQFILPVGTDNIHQTAVAGAKCEDSYQVGVTNLMCCPVMTNDFYNEWTTPNKECLEDIYELTQGLDTNADNFRIYDQTKEGMHSEPLQGYYMGLDFHPIYDVDSSLGWISVRIDGAKYGNGSPIWHTFQINFDCTSIENCKNGFNNKLQTLGIGADVTVVTNPYNGNQVLRIESNEVGNEFTESSVDIGCPYNEDQHTEFQDSWKKGIFYRKCYSVDAENVCLDNLIDVHNAWFKPCGSSFMKHGNFERQNGEYVQELLSCRSCRQALNLFGSTPSNPPWPDIVLMPPEENDRDQYVGTSTIEVVPDTDTQVERKGLKSARGGKCTTVGSTLYRTVSSSIIPYTCCEGISSQPGGNWSATNYPSPRDPVKYFWRANSDITKTDPCGGLDIARGRQTQSRRRSSYNTCLEGSPCLFTFSNLGDKCDDPDGEKMQCCESGWKKIDWQGLGNPVTGCGAWTKLPLGNYFMDDLPADKTTPKAHHNIFVMDSNPVVLTIQPVPPCGACPGGQGFNFDQNECGNCDQGSGVIFNNGGVIGICDQCPMGKFQPGTDSYRNGTGTKMVYGNLNQSLKLPEKIGDNGKVSNRKDGVITKNKCVELGYQLGMEYVSWSVRPFGSFGDTQGQLGSCIWGNTPDYNDAVAALNHNIPQSIPDFVNYWKNLRPDRQYGNSADWYNAFDTYKISSRNQCLKCASGKYNENLGQRWEQSCIECPIGYFSNNERHKCDKCQPGTYADQNGTIVCKDCSAGKYNQDNASNAESLCKECSLGKVSSVEGRSTVCDECQPGTYADQDGRTICKDCGQGKYNTHSASIDLLNCTECEKGKFSTMFGRDTVCDECQPGTYADQNGRNVCKACERGTIANTTGLTYCTDCEANYEDDLRINCIRCTTPGQGSRYPGGNNWCEQCIAGRYSFVAIDNCKYEDGYCHNNNGSGVGCGHDHYYTEGQVCHACPAGFHTLDNYSNTGLQIYKKPTTTPRCTPYNDTSCMKCPLGSVFMATPSTVQTDGGNVHPGSEVCTVCSPGHYHDVSQDQCTGCPWDTYSDSIQGALPNYYYSYTKQIEISSDDPPGGKVPSSEYTCSSSSKNIYEAKDNLCDGSYTTHGRTNAYSNQWMKVAFAAQRIGSVKIWPKESGGNEFKLEWLAEDGGTWTVCPGPALHTFAADGNSKKYACSTGTNKASAVRIIQPKNIELELYEVEIYIPTIEEFSVPSELFWSYRDYPDQPRYLNQKMDVSWGESVEHDAVTSCKKCPLGKYADPDTEGTIKTNSSYCLTCPAGRAAIGWGECADCPVDYVSSTDGNYSENGLYCSKCPIGKNSIDNQCIVKETTFQMITIGSTVSVEYNGCFRIDNGLKLASEALVPLKASCTTHSDCLPNTGRCLYYDNNKCQMMDHVRDWGYDAELLPIRYGQWTTYSGTSRNDRLVDTGKCQIEIDNMKHGKYEDNIVDVDGNEISLDTNTCVTDDDCLVHFDADFSNEQTITQGYLEFPPNIISEPEDYVLNSNGIYVRKIDGPTFVNCSATEVANQPTGYCDFVLRINVDGVQLDVFPNANIMDSCDAMAFSLGAGDLTRCGRAIVAAIDGATFSIVSFPSSYGLQFKSDSYGLSSSISFTPTHLSDTWFDLDHQKVKNGVDQPRFKYSNVKSVKLNGNCHRPHDKCATVNFDGRVTGIERFINGAWVPTVQYNKTEEMTTRFTVVQNRVGTTWTPYLRDVTWFDNYNPDVSVDTSFFSVKQGSLVQGQSLTWNYQGTTDPTDPTFFTTTQADSRSHEEPFCTAFETVAASFATNLCSMTLENGESESIMLGQGEKMTCEDGLDYYAMCSVVSTNPQTPTMVYYDANELTKPEPEPRLTHPCIVPTPTATFHSCNLDSVVEQLDTSDALLVSGVGTLLRVNVTTDPYSTNGDFNCSNADDCDIVVVCNTPYDTNDLGRVEYSTIRTATETHFMNGQGKVVYDYEKPFGTVGYVDEKTTEIFTNIDLFLSNINAQSFRTQARLNPYTLNNLNAFQLTCSHGGVWTGQRTTCSKDAKDLARFVTTKAECDAVQGCNWASEMNQVPHPYPSGDHWGHTTSVNIMNGIVTGTDFGYFNNGVVKKMYGHTRSALLGATSVPTHQCLYNSDTSKMELDSGQSYGSKWYIQTGTVGKEGETCPACRGYEFPWEDRMYRFSCCNPSLSKTCPANKLEYISDWTSEAICACKHPGRTDYRIETSPCQARKICKVPTNYKLKDPSFQTFVPDIGIWGHESTEGRSFSDVFYNPFPVKSERYLRFMLNMTVHNDWTTHDLECGDEISSVQFTIGSKNYPVKFTLIHDAQTTNYGHYGGGVVASGCTTTRDEWKIDPSNGECIFAMDYTSIFGTLGWQSVDTLPPEKEYLTPAELAKNPSDRTIPKYGPRHDMDLARSNGNVHTIKGWEEEKWPDFDIRERSLVPPKCWMPFDFTKHVYDNYASVTTVDPPSMHPFLHANAWVNAAVRPNNGDIVKIDGTEGKMVRLEHNINLVRATGYSNAVFAAEFESYSIHFLEDATVEKMYNERLLIGGYWKITEEWLRRGFGGTVEERLTVVGQKGVPHVQWPSFKVVYGLQGLLVPLVPTNLCSNIDEHRRDYSKSLLEKIGQKHCTVHTGTNGTYFNHAVPELLVHPSIGFSLGAQPHFEVVGGLWEDSKDILYHSTTCDTKWAIESGTGNIMPALHFFDCDKQCTPSSTVENFRVSEATGELECSWKESSCPQKNQCKMGGSVVYEMARVSGESEKYVGVFTNTSSVFSVAWDHYTSNFLAMLPPFQHVIENSGITAKPNIQICEQFETCDIPHEEREDVRGGLYSGIAGNENPLCAQMTFPDTPAAIVAATVITEKFNGPAITAPTTTMLVARPMRVADKCRWMSDVFRDMETLVPTPKQISTWNSAEFESSNDAVKEQMLFSGGGWFFDHESHESQTQKLVKETDVHLLPETFLSTGSISRTYITNNLPTFEPQSPTFLLGTPAQLKQYIVKYLLTFQEKIDKLDSIWDTGISGWCGVGAVRRYSKPDIKNILTAATAWTDVEDEDSWSNWVSGWTTDTSVIEQLAVIMKSVNNATDIIEYGATTQSGTPLTCSKCQNGATCKDEQPYCGCVDDWHGTYCQDEVNQCDNGFPHKCIHGTCTNILGGKPGYSCTCDSGWTGYYCDKRPSECAASPCQNNGGCTDSTTDSSIAVGDYRCDCQAGTTGVRCEEDVNECRSDVGPLSNIQHWEPQFTARWHNFGRCTHQSQCVESSTDASIAFGTYRCICAAPRSGFFCQIDGRSSAPSGGFDSLFKLEIEEAYVCIDWRNGVNLATYTQAEYELDTATTTNEMTWAKNRCVYDSGVFAESIVITWVRPTYSRQFPPWADSSGESTGTTDRADGRPSGPCDANDPRLSPTASTFLRKYCDSVLRIEVDSVQQEIRIADRCTPEPKRPEDCTLGHQYYHNGECIFCDVGKYNPATVQTDTPNSPCVNMTCNTAGNWDFFGECQCKTLHPDVVANIRAEDEAYRGKLDVDRIYGRLTDDEYWPLEQQRWVRMQRFEAEKLLSGWNYGFSKFPRGLAQFPGCIQCPAGKSASPPSQYASSESAYCACPNAASCAAQNGYLRYSDCQCTNTGPPATCITVETFEKECRSPGSCAAALNGLITGATFSGTTTVSGLYLGQCKQDLYRSLYAPLCPSYDSGTITIVSDSTGPSSSIYIIPTWRSVELFGTTIQVTNGRENPTILSNIASREYKDGWSDLSDPDNPPSQSCKLWDGTQGEFNYNTRDVFMLEPPIPVCPGTTCNAGSIETGCCDTASGSCYCPSGSGWTGAYCDVDVNECASTPCNHGTCQDSITDPLNILPGDFRCDCNTGWSIQPGQSVLNNACDHSPNDCPSPNPCLHGGTCIDGADSYTCDCAAGYSGQHCENNIDDCAYDPCARGTCIDGADSYTCDCPEDASGTYCEVVGTPNYDKISSEIEVLKTLMTPLDVGGSVWDECGPNGGEITTMKNFREVSGWFKKDTDEQVQYTPYMDFNDVEWWHDRNIYGDLTDGDDYQYGGTTVGIERWAPQYWKVMSHKVRVKLEKKEVKNHKNDICKCEPGFAPVWPSVTWAPNPEYESSKKGWVSEFISTPVGLFTCQIQQCLLIKDKSSPCAKITSKEAQPFVERMGNVKISDGVIRLDDMTRTDIRVTDPMDEWQLQMATDDCEQDRRCTGFVTVNPTADVSDDTVYFYNGVDSTTQTIIDTSATFYAYEFPRGVDGAYSRGIDPLQQKDCLEDIAQNGHKYELSREDGVGRFFQNRGTSYGPYTGVENTAHKGYGGARHTTPRGNFNYACGSCPDGYNKIKIQENGLHLWPGLRVAEIGKAGGEQPLKPGEEDLYKDMPASQECPRGGGRGTNLNYGQEVYEPVCSVPVESHICVLMQPCENGIPYAKEFENDYECHYCFKGYALVNNRCVKAPVCDFGGFPPTVKVEGKYGNMWNVHDPPIDMSGKCGFCADGFGLSATQRCAPCTNPSLPSYRNMCTRCGVDKGSEGTAPTDDTFTYLIDVWELDRHQKWIKEDAVYVGQSYGQDKLMNSSLACWSAPAVFSEYTEGNCKKENVWHTPEDKVSQWEGWAVPAYIGNVAFDHTSTFNHASIGNQERATKYECTNHGIRSWTYKSDYTVRLEKVVPNRSFLDWARATCSGELTAVYLLTSDEQFSPILDAVGEEPVPGYYSVNDPPELYPQLDNLKAYAECAGDQNGRVEKPGLCRWSRKMTFPIYNYGVYQSEPFYSQNGSAPYIDPAQTCNPNDICVEYKLSSYGCKASQGWFPLSTLSECFAVRKVDGLWKNTIVEHDTLQKRQDGQWGDRWFAENNTLRMALKVGHYPSILPDRGYGGQDVIFHSIGTTAEMVRMEETAFQDPIKHDYNRAFVSPSVDGPDGVLKWKYYSQHDGVLDVAKFHPTIDHSQLRKGCTAWNGDTVYNKIWNDGGPNYNNSLYLKRLATGQQQICKRWGKITTSKTEETTTHANCEICKFGQHGNPCRDCPRGFYGDRTEIYTMSGASTQAICTLCEAGKYQPLLAADASDMCLDLLLCGVGLEPIPSSLLDRATGTICTACVYSKYKTNQANTPCVDWSHPTYSDCKDSHHSYIIGTVGTDSSCVDEPLIECTCANGQAKNEYCQHKFYKQTLGLPTYLPLDSRDFKGGDVTATPVNQGVYTNITNIDECIAAMTVMYPEITPRRRDTTTTWVRNTTQAGQSLPHGCVYVSSEGTYYLNPPVVTPIVFPPPVKTVAVIDVGFTGQSIEACAGDHVRVTWNGRHNIYESNWPTCHSLHWFVDAYFNDGHVAIYEDMFAQPGETRHFKCKEHCTDGATFSVSCPPIPPPTNCSSEFNCLLKAVDDCSSCDSGFSLSHQVAPGNSKLLRANSCSPLSKMFGFGVLPKTEGGGCASQCIKWAGELSPTTVELATADDTDICNQLLNTGILYTATECQSTRRLRSKR